MKKFFTLIAMVCLVAASAMADKAYKLDQELTWDQVKTGETMFALVSGEDGLYGTGAQNLAFGNVEENYAETNSILYWKVEDASSFVSGAVHFRGYNAAGNPHAFWGNTPGYLNTQPAIGALTFALNISANGHNGGQDIDNGSVWNVEAVAGGYTIKSCANDGYLAGATTTATAEKVWKFYSLKAVEVVEDEVEIIPSLKSFVDNKTVFVLKNGEQFMYGSSNQNIAMGTYEVATTAGNINGYILEYVPAGGKYYFRAVKDGNNVSVYGANPCYLNSNGNVGGAVFNLGKDQDVAGGAVWLIEETKEGYILKNKASQGYIDPTGSKGTATPTVWEFVTPDDMKPNTIAADIYDVKATVTLAEGVTESMIPEEFKKYVGEYTTRATLEGDETSLVITENKEGGLFDGFQIKGDNVKVSNMKTITINEKVFNVRTADDEVAGKLAITPMVGSETPSYGMDNATIYYKDKKIATVSNIFMTIAPEEVIVKVTYVDGDQADVCLYDATATQWRAGYNAISDGNVTMAYPSWGENKITYVGVDASTMKGFVKNATLTAEVSGSSDSKRGTTWGVGYNNSTWSEDMTYNTADKSITTVGALQTQDNKSATNFKQVSFDVTDAFKDGKVKNLIIYETAAAGGYIKNIKVEFKMAATELDAVKEQALEKANALPSDGGLFSYSQTDIDNYKAAVEAATTVEEVEAIALPEMNKPSATQDYQLANVTATGTFLGEAKLVADNAEGIVRFEETEGGYYIKVNGKYLNMKGGDTWSMSATETPTTVWKINRVAEGEYTIQGPNGLIGSDNADAGSAIYGNKAINKNGKWTIEVNTPVFNVQATENAAQKIVKFFKNNMLIIVNEKGEKFNAAGQMVK